ncbi:hypothetical protein CDD83_5573 [Cordyceps sp. RAO-2017]|nr:hypothetical protein CDD83_5573 [Cordyceps sp. RAO-2017]
MQAKSSSESSASSHLPPLRTPHDPRDAVRAVPGGGEDPHFLDIAASKSPVAMKLIVAGSTGFVATELIRQALAHPAVTSIVALARRETPVPADAAAGAAASKLKSVVCSDFEKYPDSVKRDLSGADACVWTIAVTPSQLRSMSWEQACKICRDFALAGVDTISQLPRADAGKPLRFIYISGSNAVRDPAKKPWILGDYCVMRGDVESRILGRARESNGALQVAVAKPGLIDGPGRAGPVMKAAQTVGRTIIGLPEVKVGQIAAALLDQAVNGIETDTLENDDLVRIGSKALAASERNLATE